MRVYLICSPVLPDFGEYSYKSISLDEARRILSSNKFISAIQYQWDADLFRDLLGIYVPVNRAAIKLDVNDIAVVFSFPERFSEGGEPLKRDLSLRGFAQEDIVEMRGEGFEPSKACAKG
jgi:hypothetical protein